MSTPTTPEEGGPYDQNDPGRSTAAEHGSSTPDTGSGKSDPQAAAPVDDGAGQANQPSSPADDNPWEQLQEKKGAAAEQEKTGQTGDDSWKQLKEGMGQAASGAMGVYRNTVAPAVSRTAKSAYASAQAAREGSTASPAAAGRPAWPPYAIVAIAFVAFIALFMPIGSLMGMSVNFFSENNIAEGILLTIIFFITMGLALAANWLKTTVMTIVAAAWSALAGLIAVLDGFGTMIALDNMISPGIGVFLLGICGLALLVVAGMWFFATVKPAEQTLDGSRNQT